MNNSISPTFSDRVDQPYSTNSEPSSTPFTAIAARPNSTPLSYKDSGETSHSTQIKVTSPAAMFEIDALYADFLFFREKITNSIEKITEHVKLIRIVTQRVTHENLPGFFLEAIQAEVEWRLLKINELATEDSKTINSNAALKAFWINEAEAALEEEGYEYEHEEEEEDIDISDLSLGNFSLLGPNSRVETLFSSDFKFNGRDIFVKVCAPTGGRIDNMHAGIDDEGKFYLIKTAETGFVEDHKFFWVEDFNPAIGTSENETETFTTNENITITLTSKNIVSNHADMRVDLPESILNGDKWYFHRTQEPLELIDEALAELALMTKVLQKDSHLLYPNFLAQNSNDAALFTTTEARFNRVPVGQGQVITPVENLRDVDAVVDPLNSMKNISDLLMTISDFLKEISQLSVPFSKGKLPDTSLKAIQEDVDWRLRVINNQLSKISVLCSENEILKNWWKDAVGSNGIDLGSLGLKNLDFLGPQEVRLIDKNYLRINGIKTPSEVYVGGVAQPKITLALDKYDRIYLRAEAEENSSLTTEPNKARYLRDNVLQEKWVRGEGALSNVPGDKINLYFYMVNNAYFIKINLDLNAMNDDSWAHEATENPVERVDAALTRIADLTHDLESIQNLL